MNIRIRLLLPLLLCLSLTSKLSAQQFNFSLLDYSEQRLNPAYVAVGNYWVLDALHRQQQTSPDFDIASTSLSFRFPQLMANNPYLKGGIGLNFLNDKSGSTNTFEVQEVGLSYALQFQSTSGETLSFGLSVFNQNRGFNFNNFLTNAQFIPDRGFDSSLDNGEDFAELNTSYYRINAGFLYQILDGSGRSLARLGFSIFDLNRPDNTFFAEGAKTPSTYMTEIRFTLADNGKQSLQPELLWVYNAKKNRLNIGLVGEHRLGSQAQVEAGLRYLVGRDMIGHIAFVKNNLSIGMAYDLPTGGENSANRGAFEFGIKVRGLVKAHEKNKKRKAKKGKTNFPSQPQKLPSTAPIKAIPILEVPLYGLISLPMPVEPAFSQKHHPESGSARVDQTYTFNYGVNEYRLNPSYKNEFEQIVKKLLMEPAYTILIEGHADSQGSNELNYTLSMKRAEQVADFLIKSGVSKDQIKVKAYGENSPVSSNDTAMGRALNRRVMLSLIQKSAQ